MTDSEYWARYYAVTVDRPAWATVRSAIQRFRTDEGGAPQDRLAVDLGCGAGRDTRELLGAGWRVLAVDREPAAIAALEAATSAEWRPRLETRVADMANVLVPQCDLVNASLSLPFMASDEFWATWARIREALPVGGRVSAMLFGDRDSSADEPGMTCPSPEAIRESLSDFEIEDWVDREEDTETALGEPHHFHRVELVARRVHPR
jgi:tellurite methyltransferase